MFVTKHKWICSKTVQVTRDELAGIYGLSKAYLYLPKTYQWWLNFYCCFFIIGWACKETLCKSIRQCHSQKQILSGSYSWALGSPGNQLPLWAVYLLSWPSKMREWCFPGLHTFGTFLIGYSLLEEGCLFCVLGQIKVWVWRFICAFSSRNLSCFWRSPYISLLFTGLWFSLFPVILSVFPPWPEEANKVMLYFQLSIYWSYLAERVMCVSVVVMNNNICLSPPERCDEHQAHLPLVHYPMITYWNCFSASLSPQLMVHLCPV